MILEQAIGLAEAGVAEPAQLYFDAGWSVVGVRLCVDAGLLAVILVSMAVGRPFTLQYAREQATPELWREPDFLRTNYVVTGVWVLALALMTAIDATAIFTGRISLTVAVGVGLVALAGALTFSARYTARGGSPH